MIGQKQDEWAGLALEYMIDARIVSSFFFLGKKLHGGAVIATSRRSGKMFIVKRKGFSKDGELLGLDNRQDRQMWTIEQARKNCPEGFYVRQRGQTSLRRTKMGRHFPSLRTCRKREMTSYLAITPYELLSTEEMTE